MKFSKFLGDVHRVEQPARTESAWRNRKPTHLAPLLPTTSLDVPGPSITTPVYSSQRSSVLSTVSNTSSDIPLSERRAKLEHVRRRLGEEVPATAVFPSHTPPQSAVPRTSTPTSSRHPRSRARSIARLPSRKSLVTPDDARSVTFSISSDESAVVHSVTFAAARVHPRKTKKHVYQTGALPPVPPLPAHLVSGASSSRRNDEDEDDSGLIRPRQKMAAGSKIGGSDFKAARRAKREGKGTNRTSEPGEMIEMVGFLF